jgi:hypothetical protein
LEYQDAQDALATCVRDGLLSRSEAGNYELR